ncbi:3-keto-5-aminohexanoate cleavage protein [Microbacterium sp. NRRL B-14842]|uniref:3-keto-5-aminohexanoate cleavage protein n=1 Tax=Microbacterium sp. NRRL B-14842 TaxID=3162881 RepID=UPI003D2AA6B3
MLARSPTCRSCCTGRSCRPGPPSTLAAEFGLDTRIGLEDTLLLPDGSEAPSNAALVRAARARLPRPSHAASLLSRESAGTSLRPPDSGRSCTSDRNEVSDPLYLPSLEHDRPYAGAMFAGTSVSSSSSTWSSRFSRCCSCG